MQINKILINNFNSFEGINELDFTSTNPKKNIILIGGKNGAGKTSLFNAIKIALYGPLTFGYIGINPHYIAKVKEFINSRAFQTSEVTSMVQISITLVIDREKKNYVITRKWNYTAKKFEETFTISEDGKALSESEISYFENYLLSQIPPDLFEFFFFDGEEVGSVFATPAYNKYIKNAIYKLNGLDTYEHIRRISSGYSGADLAGDEVALEFEEVKSRINEADRKKEELRDRLDDCLSRLDTIEVELTEIDAKYQKAGGLSEKEKKELSTEYSKNEQIKAEASAAIKSFVEGLMPFFIVKDMFDGIECQIENEEKAEISRIVRNNIRKEDIIQRIQTPKSEKVVSDVIELIYDMFSVQKDSPSVFNLSKDESRQIDSVIGSISSFDKKRLISQIKSRRVASDRNMKINNLLKSSLSEDESKEYLNKLKELVAQKEELQKLVYECQTGISALDSELDELSFKKDSLNKQIREDIQAKNVSEISSGMENVMAALLETKTLSIRKELESGIVDKLKRILRKDNLITHVEIDSDFSFNLYQDSSYSPSELLHLIENVGKDEFLLTIGNESVEKLKDLFNLDSSDLIVSSLQSTKLKKIELHKLIELDKLSKGERQVFILAFYWSVIELSSQEIPFIIDTPYARIDAGHRKGISKHFFPNISNQVIILSTDEEISEEYYKLIKPYVSREYLLSNDRNQNKTTITKGYFFED